MNIDSDKLSSSAYQSIDATNARVLENCRRFIKKFPLTAEQLLECHKDIHERINAYNNANPHESVDFNTYFHSLTLCDDFISTKHVNVVIERFKIGFVLFVGGGYYTIPKLHKSIIPVLDAIIKIASTYTTDNALSEVESESDSALATNH